MPSTVLGRLRRRLPGRNQDPAFNFQINTGVYRAFTEVEVRELCARAGFQVVDERIEDGYGHSSWVVVVPAM